MKFQILRPVEENNPLQVIPNESGNTAMKDIF